MGNVAAILGVVMLVIGVVLVVLFGNARSASWGPVVGIALVVLGLVAGLLPAVTWLNKGYGHSDFDPIYETAERLDMPLTVHGAPSRGMGFDFFNKFLHVHTLEHPFAILIQFTHMVFEGVFVRFPKLRVAFLEAGSGWLPYMMDRMDEEMEKPYRVQAPLLKQKPSELIRNGQIWTTCEV